MHCRRRRRRPFLVCGGVGTGEGRAGRPSRSTAARTAGRSVGSTASAGSPLCRRLPAQDGTPPRLPQALVRPSPRAAPRRTRPLKIGRVQGRWWCSGTGSTREGRDRPEKKRKKGRHRGQNHRHRLRAIPTGGSPQRPPRPLGTSSTVSPRALRALVGSPRGPGGPAGEQTPVAPSEALVCRSAAAPPQRTAPPEQPSTLASRSPSRRSLLPRAWRELLLSRGWSSASQRRRQRRRRCRGHRPPQAT
mmetsp:Transcript_63205/g.126870  ORF Transcript_63205/g.126870 Transcript_63205/m.126870 type:complete len:247 (-) Transcript_63205:441-1181(-)